MKISPLHTRLPLTTWIFLGLSAFIMLFVVRNGWLSDDIYITFRTLYNFTHGHGLRWNITERVQTYTHPLWMFTLLPFYAVTQHAWFTATFVSLLFTFLSLILLFRIARNPLQGLLCVLLWVGSKALMDFSTSGLENPLTHFLLLLFATELFKSTDKSPNFFRLGLWAALLMLNRMDHLLIIAPVIAGVWLTNRNWKNLGLLALGFTPLILWELFSLVYYGFPFPNTYYAKVLTDFPRKMLLEQGLWYQWDSLLADPMTLPLIALAGILTLIRGAKRARLLLIGLIVYWLYTIWVGGDFMSGRFIATPALLGFILLSRVPLPKAALGIITGSLLLLSFLNPYPPLLTGKNYYKDRAGNEQALYPKGIVDEKGMAWWRSGMLGLNSESDVFKVEREIKTWEPHLGDIVLIKEEVAVGFRGYQNGPTVFIVDKLALTDPLLARMPAHDVPYWRIGHFFRKVPPGYVSTLESGTNTIEDQNLAEYYNQLGHIIQGPLFTRERWKQIIRFNLGMNKDLIDRKYWREFDPAHGL